MIKGISIINNDKIKKLVINREDFKKLKFDPKCGGKKIRIQSKRNGDLQNKKGRK